MYELTIKRLNSFDIITGKLNIRDISLVPWIHDGVTHVGMFQSQTVTKLVNRHPVQVDAVTRSCGESFVVVEMSVTGKTWNK